MSATVRRPEYLIRAGNSAAFLRDLCNAAWKNAGPVREYVDGSFQHGEGPDLCRAERVVVDRHGRTYRVTAEQLPEEN